MPKLTQSGTHVSPHVLGAGHVLPAWQVSCTDDLGTYRVMYCAAPHFLVASPQQLVAQLLAVVGSFLGMDGPATSTMSRHYEKLLG